MDTRDRIVAVITIAILVLAASPTMSNASTSIMPLGDSITNGVHNISYRTYLDNMLTEGNYDYSLVGSRYGLGSYHEGYGGYSPRDLSEKMNTILEKNNPDIVLLHIGSNGLWNGSIDYDSATENWGWGVAAVKEILDSLYSANNNIKIFLAQILDTQKHCDRNSEYNRQLKVMTDSYEHQEIFTLINFENILGNDPSMYVDAVHVSENGAKRMAEEWYAAVSPTLSQTPIPGTVWLLTIGLTGLINVRRKKN